MVRGKLQIGNQVPSRKWQVKDPKLSKSCTYDDILMMMIIVMILLLVILMMMVLNMIQ